MFAVDLDDLLATVDDLARCGAQLEAALAAIAGVHLPWTGHAALAQAAAQIEWEAEFSAMREALAVMRSAASAAHENYSDAADTNLRMWEQVR